MAKACHLCFLFVSVLALIPAAGTRAATRDYAVEVGAIAHESPARIEFSWAGDPDAEQYRIYRKTVVETVWAGPVAVLEGGATSWTDTDIVPGEAYEYAFKKAECIISDTVTVAGGTALTFTIHDSWGDGICCDMGLGSYRVSGPDTVYASGGAFGSSEAASFTAGSAEDSCAEVAVDIALDIFSGETTWELTRDATGDTLVSGGPYSPPRFGHVLAGIAYPAPEDWGTVLLLVDEPAADSLSPELERLELDLIRDGYRVLRRDIPDGTPVPSVKSVVLAECQADPSITTLFILGNVAVPYSGNVTGAHTDHQGAWPADLYYGELDAEWTDCTVNNTRASRPENHNVPGDGKFDQTFLPSDVDLMVGRVDLSRLPAFAESEVDLLRRYLDKNHAFRTGGVQVPRRGLIRDAVGEIYGAAYACTGWRNFTAMFGPGNVNTNTWLPALESNPYLCAYGCGAGSFTSCATVATTADFATRTIYAVYTMLMGSYFGDWDSLNNIMRAALAARGYPLTCCWAGRPAWLFHHMALGYPIGYSTRVTQNNHVLYEIGYGGRQIHTALMGDPTLRLCPVPPPTGLVLEGLSDHTVRLSWRSPADTVAGYHVYRAESLSSGFTRLDSDLVGDTAFVDAEPVEGSGIYMVRAVKLETTASGTFLNPSPGVIDSIEVSAGVAPLPNSASLRAWPNPFRAHTTIYCCLPGPAAANLSIYDAAGRLVKSMDLGECAQGMHATRWDGRDSRGRRAASGVYFMSLKAGEASASAKVILTE